MSYERRIYITIDEARLLHEMIVLRLAEMGDIVDAKPKALIELRTLLRLQEKLLERLD